MTLKAKHKQQKKQNRALKILSDYSVLAFRKLRVEASFWFDMQEFRLTPVIKHPP